MSTIDAATKLRTADMPAPNFRGRAESLNAVAKLGRVQLSRHFFLRDFLYSEIGAVHGLPNLPHDPNLAIKAGRKLAENLLEPLVETFGPIVIRSAYRSPEVNGFGSENNLGCSSNERNRAAHIWDMRDTEGRMGATVSVVIPWFARRYDKGRNWQDLAWWLYDHLDFNSIQFFPTRAAFNLNWREAPRKRIYSYISPKGWLLAETEEPTLNSASRAERYADFPPYRGIVFPE